MPTLKLLNTDKLQQIGRKVIKEKNIDMDYLDYLLEQKKSKSKDNSMPPSKTKTQGQTTLGKSNNGNSMGL